MIYNMSVNRYTDDDFDYGYDIDDLDIDGDRQAEEHGKEMPPPRPVKKRRRVKWDNIIILLVIAALSVLLVFLIRNFMNEQKDNNESLPAAASTANSKPTVSDIPQTTAESNMTETTPEKEPEPPKPAFPVETDITVIDGVTYINGILIINKTYGVPESYDPGVDPTAEAKLQEMYAAAANEDIILWTASGYRTYDYQKKLYDDYVDRDGKEAADTYSARPGFSEHESGLTFDVCDPSSSFDDTEEAAWLEEHCAEYGFIIRYPEGKEDITGFMYESWHVRYVGEELAKIIMENDICLEEYFGITSEYADE